MLNEKFRNGFNTFNKSIGDSLSPLNMVPYSIEGREKELELLNDIMNRPRTPVAALVADAGVGKSALVEEFSKRCNSNAFNFGNVNCKYVVLSLQVGSLSALGNNRLQKILTELFDNIKKIELFAQQVLRDKSIQFILFIDEFHMLVTIFGPGTKIGGDVMKEKLARPPIRVIAATTRKEYDSTIATDEPLKQRFKNIEMNELPKHIVKTICKNWWDKVEPTHPKPTDAVIDKVLNVNALYRSDSAEPRKSLDIMEDLVSYCRRTGLPVTEEKVNDIFKRRYSINLSFNQINPNVVIENLNKRIIGQPFAIFEMSRAIKSMVYQLDPTTNRPILRLLFVGTTGVGKTETVKVLQESLYPNENVLLNINMPDFEDMQYEPLFRKKIGEYVRHTPNAIILLDEIEKAHKSVLNSLLSILDEGIVNFDVLNRERLIETHSVSLRNTIVIATSNAASEIFDNDALFSQTGESLEITKNSKAEMKRLNKDVLANLKGTKKFKPELLGRFNSVVSYRRLNDQALLHITEKKLEDLAYRFKNLKGIEIIFDEPRQWNRQQYDFYSTDVAVFIMKIKANATDPSSGGARAIQREIDYEVYGSIVDCAMDNPDCRKFHVSVSRDARIYDSNAPIQSGEVIVSAIYEVEET